MAEVIHQFLVRFRPVRRGLEEHDGINEQRSVNGQVWVESVVDISAYNVERLRKNALVSPPLM